MIVRSMSYITSKFTKIVDWRLAVFYYIMIVACFGGILASLPRACARRLRRAAAARSARVEAPLSRGAADW